jgi:ubiquinone/menaquinone biosynthesis C-methylase UbiE
LVACHNNPPLGGVITDAGGGGVIDGDLLQNYREEMQMNSGWQLSGDAPTAYVRFALKIMEPWTDDLIRSAGCRDGDRVLDVACGTGIVANRVNLVSGKLCTVTGIDVNEGMLSVARRNPQIEWHQGSATDLPFEPDNFDVVLCQQGLQYVPDRAAAMKEMTRILSPGGRLALNVWGALERQPFQAAMAEAIERFLGAEARAPLALACSLNTAEELRSLAVNAGLQNIRIRFEHRTLRYPAPAGLAAGFIGATPAAAQFAELSADSKQAFIAYVAEKLASYVDDSGMAVPYENHFLTASKPA